VGQASAVNAQRLAVADLAAVKKNEMTLHEDGFFQAAGTDAYLVWSNLRTAQPAAGGLVLQLEFAEPLPTRTFWELFWGSENEGFSRDYMLYFTAGRAGDTNLRLWLPIGEHPLYRSYPFADLKELRLGPAFHFNRAFRVVAMEVHQSRPEETLTPVTLHHFGSPQTFVRVDRSTRIGGRILSNWTNRWTEDWVFTIGFFFSLALLLVVLVRITDRQNDSK
jgi:hypothetical protein